MAKTKSEPKLKKYCDNPDCDTVVAKKDETTCSKCRRLQYRLSLRIKCSNYFNDTCQNCGFLRETIEDLNVFDFHHINMGNKQFSISDSIIKNTWDEIKQELEKCTMLCKFCHAYQHVSPRNDFIKNGAIKIAQEGQ